MLGRTRATEDVDLLIYQPNFLKFKEMWEEIEKNDFECMNTSDAGEAYKMLEEFPIRFFKKGGPIPNMEIKLIKTDLDKYSYENRINVILTSGNLFISPIELQIAYKLFLAADGTDEELKSDKDIEDARHLYQVFREKLNKEEFLTFINKLNVKKKSRFLE